MREREREREKEWGRVFQGRFFNFYISFSISDDTELLKILYIKLHGILINE